MRRTPRTGARLRLEKQLLIHLLAKARASLLGASGRGEAAAP